MRRLIGAVAVLLGSAAFAGELPRGKTIVIERTGECQNAPAAAVHSTLRGQLRFYVSEDRIYQSFAADSIKSLAYVADGREHVAAAFERGRRFPVTTQASWDGGVLSASYRYDLDGALLRTQREAAYRIEIDAAGRCRLQLDEFKWRQTQKNGTLLRDSSCRATTSTCTIVAGESR